MTEEEERMVRRAAAGDGEAFRWLLDKYAKAVHTTLYRMVGGWYPNDLEDFTQDVFLKIFRALPRFDFDRRTKFSTWMYTFVRNYAFDLMKRHHARPTLLPLQAPGPDAPERALADLAPRPDEVASRDEAARLVRETIRTLPPKLREAIVLRQYQGLPFAEVAEVIGTTEGTAKARYHRAREVLRRRLLPRLREERGEASREAQR